MHKSKKLKKQKQISLTSKTYKNVLIYCQTH